MAGKIGVIGRERHLLVTRGRSRRGKEGWGEHVGEELVPDVLGRTWGGDLRGSQFSVAGQRAKSVDV